MLKLRRFDSADPRFPVDFMSLLAATPDLDETLTATVSAILKDVKTRGRRALVEYTNRFDRRRVTAADLEVPRARLQESLDEIAPDLRQALERAAERILAYHRRQPAQSWEYQDQAGSTLGQRVTPLDRVGIYVPGGKAAYPSTVLMNALPAKVAGVLEIIMVMPAPDDQLNPVALAAAAVAGVDRVFSVGGAQAIAALAYGVAPLPPVDKIVGPGNRYVAAAKRQVFGVVGIDMIAGPSEVVVVADDSADPDWVAMDMFAQAEHDEDARAILISDSETMFARVEAAMNRQLQGLARATTIRAALENNGALIRTPDLRQACELVNRLAPEHLELAVADPDALLPAIRNAGAIFLGCHAAEALGDYCAGPNHVLPTGGTARFSSPLGAQDFQKRASVIRCTPDSAADLAPTAATLARSEGLTAHARAAELRLTKGATTQ